MHSRYDKKGPFLNSVVQGDRAHAQLPPKYPESGFGRHPAFVKRFSLERSVWMAQRHAPVRAGVYEMEIDDEIVYACWDGHSWSCADALVPSQAPWRGLANDPYMPYVTFEDPPGTLRPGVAIAGYVEHSDPSSPRVRLVHVAKTIRSKDGDLLTVCGHVSRSQTPLRLWCDTLAIKAVDGDRPELCAVCASLTFDGDPAGAQADPEGHAPGELQANPAQNPRPDNTAVPTPATQPVLRTLNPQFAVKQRMRFSGGISYRNYPTGSSARVFELLSTDRVQLELVSAVDDNDVPSSVLRAIATRQGQDGRYRTGLVQLTTPEGRPHPYGHAEFTFAIWHLTEEMVRIEGWWKDEDGTKYPFSQALPRVRELTT